MVLANQNAKLTGPDQGFLVSRLVLTLKPWERGWYDPAKARNGSQGQIYGGPLGTCIFRRKLCLFRRI